MDAWRSILVGCLFGWLLLSGAAHAGPGVQLPAGEDVALWTTAFRLAGLSARADDDAPLRVEVHEAAWGIVAVAANGEERRITVDPPASAADREAVAFLARGLLRDVLRSARRASSRPAAKVPADQAPGSGEDRRAPATKGTSAGRPGAPSRAPAKADGLRLDGTDAPGEPVPVPTGDAPIRARELPSSGVPPLSLRVGAAARPGTATAPQFHVGTRLFRRGRLQFDLELGGVVARDVGLALPRRLGQFDVEGTASVTVAGGVAVGLGVGTSYRRYRQSGLLVDHHLVPTTHLRVDAPLFSSRRFSVLARVQGKLDLARTELGLPGGTTILDPLEVQTALVLRYRGALGLLPDAGRRR